jgi:hypothetical protein
MVECYWQEKAKNWKKTPSQCHVAPHKFRVDWPGREVGPPRWETGYQPPEPLHICIKLASCFPGLFVSPSSCRQSTTETIWIEVKQKTCKNLAKWIQWRSVIFSDVLAKFRCGWRGRENVGIRVHTSCFVFRDAQVTTRHSLPQTLRN